MAFSTVPNCSDEQSSWIKNFFDYCKVNNCVADLINTHFYDNNFVEDSLSDSFDLKNLEKRCSLNEDVFTFTKYINKVKNYFKNQKISHLPVYLTEWNLTVSHRDLINDTSSPAI